MATSLVGPQIVNFRSLARRTVGTARRRANPVGCARRIISRPDDHWENELIPAVDVCQGMKIADLNVDLFARLDVGY